LYLYNTYAPQQPYVTQTLTQIQYPEVKQEPHCVISGCVRPETHSTDNHPSSNSVAGTPTQINIMHSGTINFKYDEPSSASVLTSASAPASASTSVSVSASASPSPSSPSLRKLIVVSKPIPTVFFTTKKKEVLAEVEIEEEKEVVKNIMCAAHICKMRSMHETAKHYCEYKQCQMPYGHSESECAWKIFDQTPNMVNKNICQAVACNERTQHTFNDHFCNYCNKEGGNIQCIRCKNAYKISQKIET
jgi:hypothetical protein